MGDVGGNEEPVAWGESEDLTADGELRLALEKDDPFVVVLVEVDRLVEGSAQDLLDDKGREIGDHLDVLAGRGRLIGVA